MFFISKQNTHGEGFVFGLILLPVLLISPGPHRLRNQQKDTAGWSESLWSHVIDFRPLVALNLCVLCPSPDPFCQVAWKCLGKTFLKVWCVCICSLQLLYGQMLASDPSSHFAHHSTYTSSPSSASLQVFLGRALSRKLQSSSRHCVCSRKGYVFTREALSSSVSSDQVSLFVKK